MITGPIKNPFIVYLDKSCLSFGRYQGGGNNYSLMLACSLTLCLVLISPASGTDELQEVMQALSGVERSELRYKEEKQLAMLDQPLLQTGNLKYVAPDQFTRSLDGSASGQFTVNGDQVILEKKSGRDIYDLNKLPMIKAFVASFGATLSGDLPKLQRYYEVSFSGGVTEWRLDLQPRDTQLASYITKIQLWGSYDKINGMEIHETNGDWSRMILLYD